VRNVPATRLARHGWLIAIAVAYLYAFPYFPRIHSANELPILLAGKGGGSLETGRVLDYLGHGDEHRKICSLHLSLMDRMGVKLDKFGDATARLANL